SLLVALVSASAGVTWQWLRAEQLLHQSERQLTALSLNQALDLCDRGEAAQGMIKLSQTLRSAPADATDLRRVIRANLASWSQHIFPLTASLNHKTRHGLRTIAFSSDGKTISTASWDGTARLWDAATGAAIGAPVTHQGRVMAAA